VTAMRQTAYGGAVRATIAIGTVMIAFRIRMVARLPHALICRDARGRPGAVAHHPERRLRTSA
jgi:hypothetical protein